MAGLVLVFDWRHPYEELAFVKAVSGRSPGTWEKPPDPGNGGPGVYAGTVETGQGRGI